MARYQHTKYQQIVKLISRRIRNGEYPDGKLPAARTLALEMGVSYLTALKALHELRESGLIGYDRSNRKIAIGRAAARHPLVGVITPFWGYSAWMQSINEVTAELGGAARFIAYSSDSDPLITEALSCPYDLFFIELPKHLDRRLRERIRKLGRRVVVLYSDMSAEGIRSLVGSSPESIELIMQRLLDSGRCRRIDAVGSPGEMDLDMQTRIDVWRGFLRKHHLQGEFHNPGILSFERPERKCRQLMLDLIDSGDLPDAVFCVVPSLAPGIYRACYERKIRIGRDISLFSFGELEFARHLTPALTTIGNTQTLNTVMRELLSQYLPGNTPDDRLLFQLKEFTLFPGESLALGDPAEAEQAGGKFSVLPRFL